MEVEEDGCENFEIEREKLRIIFVFLWGFKERDKEHARTGRNRRAHFL